MEDPDVARRLDRVAPAAASTSWPGVRPGSGARFSATVLPVTVRQSPSSSPSASRYFITAGRAADRVQILLHELAAGLEIGQDTARGR